ncbi:MAG: DUF4124 domain-containing protein [Pseudomonadota bacterium]
MSKTGSSIAIAVIFTLVNLPAMAENYYRWLDERGRPVYSQTPPPQGIDYTVESTTSSAIREVSANEGAVPATTAPSVGNEFVQASRDKQEASKSPEACRRAQANIGALDQGVEIKMRDANGEMRLLTDEEKSIQRQKAIDTIAVHCD